MSINIILNWSIRDNQNLPVFPSWPFGTWLWNSKYLWISSIVAWSFKVSLRLFLLHESMRVNKYVGCVSTFYSSHDTSNSRCSRALFTAFKLKRAFANAFPFNTFFIQPFVSSHASSIISAYPDPLILWLVSIPMKFISVWKRPWITTCSLSLSGKVNIKGRAFIYTPRSKVFMVYFWSIAFVASTDCCNSSWTVSYWVIGRGIV